MGIEFLNHTYLVLLVLWYVQLYGYHFSNQVFYRFVLQVFRDACKGNLSLHFNFLGIKECWIWMEESLLGLSLKIATNI